MTGYVWHQKYIYIYLYFEGSGLGLVYNVSEALFTASISNSVKSDVKTALHIALFLHSKV